MTKMLDMIEERMKTEGWKQMAGNKVMVADFPVAAYYYKFAADHSGMMPCPGFYEPMKALFKAHPLVEKACENLRPLIADHLANRPERPFWWSFDAFDI